MSNIVGSGGSTPPETGARPIVRLRAMRRDDIAAGLRLCRASHWNQVTRDWDLFLALSPDGCRVAVDETGYVVGSVAAVRYGKGFGWVAMVLVDPSRRRAGIGTLLLEEALALLDDMAVVRLDATPAGYYVYERAGFQEEYQLQRMERPAQALPPDRSADTATTLVRRMGDDDIEDVLAWDLEVFGADRRALLDAFRARAPEYAWVSGPGQIDGYLFGRHGHTYDHLGPLVARDEEAARRLVSACLAAHPDRQFILDAPPHASWTAWLQSLQFTVQRPFIRMYRGEHRHRERTDQMFAIAGAEFA